MGNRAVITWSVKNEPEKSNDLGIYLHWNGGRDSVESFLKYCKLKGYRTPDADSYGYTYLCQIICNFFGDGLSVGIGPCSNLDCNNYDNGMYICKGWEIVGRRFAEFDNPVDHDYVKEMIIAINSCMPKSQQLRKSVILRKLKEEQ